MVYVGSGVVGGGGYDRVSRVVLVQRLTLWGLIVQAVGLVGV